MSTGDNQSASSPFRLLIVDESADERLEIQRLLRAGSDRIYDFIDADSGASAVKLILAANQPVPDCVLLSESLPDFSATEFLAAIHSAGGLSLCPVVVLTCKDGPNVGRELLRAGAQDYVGKAWMTPQCLTRSIENAAERWALAGKLIHRNDRLSESEKQFRVIFASAAVGIARVELDGRFAEINEAFCRMHGYDREEMLQLSVQQVTHPDDVAVDMAFMETLLDGSRVTYTIEKRKIRKDGTTIWVNHAVSLDRLADGSPYQFISTVHDISD